VALRNPAHSLQAAQNVVVELQYRSQALASGAVSSAGVQKSIYVGWTGMPSKSTVEIDATFAKLVGLSDGQKVGILLHLDPPVAHTVNIEPLTPGDWEIIELHATFLELNLLSQVRALPNPTYSPTASIQAEYSHPLTLHLSPTSTANIIVTSLLPPIPNTAPFAKIAPDAEVIVAPKVRPKSGRGVRGDTRSVASRRSGKSGVSTARARSSQKPSDRRKPTFLRGVDRSVAQAWFEEETEDSANRGLQVWLSKEVMASDSLKGTAWVSVSVVKPAGLRGQLDQTQVQS
jgi:peroxin-1